MTDPLDIPGPPIRRHQRVGAPAGLMVLVLGAALVTLLALVGWGGWVLLGNLMEAME